ncbi:hypothetical protein KN400_0542 [Geobacter sulfurreducens KN400]|nr:hypothetical protein KN400_0542 [Geobacter sulfurreducens KN400]
MFINARPLNCSNISSIFICQFMDIIVSSYFKKFITVNIVENVIES